MTRLLLAPLLALLACSANPSDHTHAWPLDGLTATLERTVSVPGLLDTQPVRKAERLTWHFVGDTYSFRRELIEELTGTRLRRPVLFWARGVILERRQVAPRHWSVLCQRLEGEAISYSTYDYVLSEPYLFLLEVTVGEGVVRIGDLQYRLE